MSIGTFGAVLLAIALVGAMTSALLVLVLILHMLVSALPPAARPVASRPRPHRGGLHRVPDVFRRWHHRTPLLRSANQARRSGHANT